MILRIILQLYFNVVTESNVGIHLEFCKFSRIVSSAMYCQSSSWQALTRLREKRQKVKKTQLEAFQWLKGLIKIDSD